MFKLICFTLFFFLAVNSFGQTISDVESSLTGGGNKEWIKEGSDDLSSNACGAGLFLRFFTDKTVEWIECRNGSWKKEKYSWSLVSITDQGNKFIVLYIHGKKGYKIDILEADSDPAKEEIHLTSYPFDKSPEFYLTPKP